MLALQIVEGEKPDPTPKRSTFRPSVFFKNLMQKCEAKNTLKEKSTVTITAEVHQETPRCPPADRKQKTPMQILQATGRFSMQVEDIPVNVEVVHPHPLVSSVVSYIVSKVMDEDKAKKDPSKHSFQGQDKDKDDNNDNDDKTDSDCGVVEMSVKDTEHVSNVVSHVKWMAQEMAKRQQFSGFEYDKFMEELTGRAKK